MLERWNSVKEEELSGSISHAWTPFQTWGTKMKEENPARCKNKNQIKNRKRGGQPAIKLVRNHSGVK